MSFPLYNFFFEIYRIYGCFGLTPPVLFAFDFLSPTPRAFPLLSERISTLAVHSTIQQFIRIAWLKHSRLASLILRPAIAALPTLNARVPKLSESPTTPYCTDSVRYNVLAPTLIAHLMKQALGQLRW